MLHQRLTRHMVALGVGAVLAGTLTLWSAWKLYQGNTALREIAELRIVTLRLEIAHHEQASSLLGHLQDADATRVEAIQVDARKAAQALRQLQGANRLLDAQLDARQAEGLNQLAWARFFALGSTFLLVLLLISAVVSMQAIRRRLSTGLEPLLLLAQRIGAGDLTSAVPAGPVHDEFGQVAQAFAQMREKMCDHLVSLTELHRAQDEVRQLAYVDALTGLPNRARFAQRLDEAIKVARRRAENIALLFIDLDGFKDVNDSLGHDQGDVLLRHVGVCLQRVVREVDVVARLGGDEFCVLLSDVTDSAQAAHTAQRCLDVLGEPLPLGGTVVHPRGSVGIALYPRDAAHASGLLKAADTAMYAAKSRGKHGFAIYEAGMTDAVEQRLALGAALRCAIERDELMLHYQPKVSLVSGEMLGVEALVRWQRPGFGLVPPDQFIGVAEQIGLIGALGEWVLETACRQATAWRSQGMANLDMAVNISPSHFESPGFVDMVGRVVSAHDMPTGALEIEVTESITRNPKRHIAICVALRKIGVQVAIDDFGTGYSSLSVLKHMQVDTLKLDRQFIQDMTGDASSAVMIGTIIGLAAGLNFAVVAEGVETLEQVQVLSGLGCPMAQGYFFSRPVRAEQIPALARTNFLARHAAAQPTQRVHAQLEAKEVTS